MKLLFEEYGYRYEDVKSLLPGYLWTLCKDGKVKTTYVGYFFSKEIKDSVFILPKVFLDKDGNAFKKQGQKPDGVIDADTKDNIEEADKEIMFSLSVWIYQAIQKFIERNPENNITDQSAIQNVIDVRGEDSETLLESVLALKKFAKEHRHLFTYISKINHSGANKIHWDKTISRVNPLIKDGIPYYLEFRTKKKAINFDEDIIILFYSVIAYINRKYKFHIEIDVNFDLYPVSKIESMIETGKGTRILHSIRKKYFTDDLVALWKLLYVFFDKMERIEANMYHEETLLVRSFNNVFEDMVDQMLGDPQVNKELKYQDDGKIVDHIYPYASLINENSIYYIGDSKYYKAETSLGKYSITKQYTYAKNVVQYNIDLLNSDPSKLDGLYYRDSVTEGYNITPNFFIKGIISNDEYDYSLHLANDTDEDGKIQTLINFHFPNRLFDRDTYILQTYNVNFLYVISSYVTGEDEDIKRFIHKKFKEDLLLRFNDLYNFYLLVPKDGDITESFNRNFRALIGKVIRPSENKNTLVLALEAKTVLRKNVTLEQLQEENLQLLTSIEKDFSISKFTLGNATENIETSLKKSPAIRYYKALYDSVDEKLVEEQDECFETIQADSSNIGMIDLVKCNDFTYLLGYCKGADHRKWIFDNKSDGEQGVYNIRLGSRPGECCEVGPANFLILYDGKANDSYDVYELSDHQEIWDEDKMKATNYKAPKGKYFIYHLVRRAQMDKLIDIKKVIKEKNNKSKGLPIYLKGSELESYMK